jgi:hypothetical protein
MSSVRSLAIALALVGATTVACGTSSDDPAASSSGAPPVTTPEAGPKPSEAPCSEPADQRPAGSACVKTVAGRLVEDGTSAPVKLLTTVCGTGLCLLGDGDANGFTVPVNRFVNLDAFVVHVDGRPTHANVYVRLAPASSDAIVLATPIRVPRLDQVGLALPQAPPGAALVLKAGDVALTLAPTTVVELDFADASLEAEGRKLRSGVVSSAVMSDPKLVVLHALSPFAATLTPAAEVAITLPAAAAIADGTAVEIVALDDTLDSPENGKLKVVASGTVTGGIAKSDPGTGLTRLTWVGVRKKGS